ncbi:hypothetical protein PFFCH_05757 [Plasmodium falciparum FCH/4]|uniref:Surface antigen n=1 Tax=Plasmodium falciparum FCH/4 TaxID=1036724 RepID=A0A024VF53_PLAFA|nr:hypothetical protein PFFCH_05757 [Plasmodium falciparum FCH/4]
MTEGTAQGAAAGEAAGFAKFIELVKSTFNIQNIAGKALDSVYTVTNYTDVSLVTGSIYSQYEGSKCIGLGTIAETDISFCSTITKLGHVPGYVTGNTNSITAVIESNVKKIVADATTATVEFTKTATKAATDTITKQKTSEITATYMIYQSTIIASVVAILKKKDE